MTPERSTPMNGPQLGATDAHDERAEALLAAIVRQIALGNKASLGELFDATSDLVYALACRLLSDPLTADEVVLDVFQYVWKRAELFDPERGKVRTWLMTITRSRSQDRLRSSRARSDRESSLDESSRASADSGPASVLEASERQGILARALQDLPHAQRRAIELAFFDGLSHADTARRVGLPLGTVKSHVRRGLLRLHSLLELER